MKTTMKTPATHHPLRSLSLAALGIQRHTPRRGLTEAEAGAALLIIAGAFAALVMISIPVLFLP